jgi:hypothetical protein
VPVIIGGGTVDEQTGMWTGADLWTNDASRGVKLIREAIAAARSCARATLDSASRLPYRSPTACRNGRHMTKGPVLTGGVT